MAEASPSSLHRVVDGYAQQLDPTVTLDVRWPAEQPLSRFDFAFYNH